MSWFRLLITLCILNWSSSVQSETQKEYMIEVIVFEQLEIIGNEQLEPQDLNLTDLDTITLLKKPAIVLNEKTILQSFDFDDADLMIEQLIIDKNKKEQIQANDPPTLGK
ncbi:hypothetical protein OAJ62_04505, partial [Pseudomonadota bacterium]|nr:hypothetical protein [Pseudomonadota bacterium]